MSGAEENLIEDIAWEIGEYLDKKKWWRHWLKPLLYYGSIILPFAYLIGWYQGYF